jgi:hypothetical protein
MATDTAQTAKPHRRWFRFRLRTLLIVVTVLSIPLVWIGWELKEIRKEQPTTAWILNAGGKVGTRNIIPAIHKSRWDDFRRLLFGGRVRGVSLSATSITDLSRLAELKHLEWLSLSHSKVTDLSPLTELKNLKFLDLYGTQLTDEQMTQLRKGLPGCEVSTTTIMMRGFVFD